MSRQYSDLQRWQSFPRELGPLAENLGEFARDANQALKRRLLGYVKEVTHYAATGDPSTKIPLAQPGDPPFAVILVYAVETENPVAVVNAKTGLQFTYEHGSLNVLEPSGLTANVTYDLRFLVLEV